MHLARLSPFSCLPLQPWVSHLRMPSPISSKRPTAPACVTVPCMDSEGGSMTAESMVRSICCCTQDASLAQQRDMKNSSEPKSSFTCWCCSIPCDVADLNSESQTSHHVFVINICAMQQVQHTTAAVTLKTPAVMLNCPSRETSEQSYPATDCQSVRIRQSIAILHIFRPVHVHTANTF